VPPSTGAYDIVSKTTPYAGNSESGESARCQGKREKVTICMSFPLYTGVRPRVLCGGQVGPSFIEKKSAGQLAEEIAKRGGRV